MRALIEPLAVGFHAAMQGGARIGQTAVVMGAGCIGLVTMMALKAMGVSKVYVVDIMEKRLAKAMELGADGVINGSKTDAVEEVRKLTEGKGCDLALDKELTFKTVFRYRHIYPMAIDAVAAGKVNLKGIVTNGFDVDDVKNAMDYSVNNQADIVKSVIRISK